MIQLDSFPGTDDQKLTAAMHHAAAQTVKPVILLGSRTHSFWEMERKVYSGFKLAGQDGVGNQQRSANSIGCDVRVHGAGSWLRLLPGNVFDVNISGIGFQGNRNAQFMATGGSILWTSFIRDVGFNLWKHVLGRPGEKFLNTACQFDGWWNTNNCFGRPYTFGGSDTAFTWGRHIIDVGQGAARNVFPAGEFLIHFDHQQKSEVSGLYMTCEGNVSGIRIDGSLAGGPLELRSPRVEGRNPWFPSSGTLIDIRGGLVDLVRPWASFWAGQGAPVMVRGGVVDIDRPRYDRAAGTPEATPWLWQTGGFVELEKMKVSHRGGGWSGPARVRVTSNSALDSSVVRG